MFLLVCAIEEGLCLDKALLGKKTWQLRSYQMGENDYDSSQRLDSAYSLRFDTNTEEIYGNLACNSFYAPYRLIGDTLAVRFITPANLFCPPTNPDIDLDLGRELINALSNPLIIQLVNKRLILSTKDRRFEFE